MAIGQTKEAERSGKEAERSGKEAERSGKEAERGGGSDPARVAESLFRQVGELGGFLVVAMITPVPPSPRSSVSPRPKGPIAQVAQKARDRENEAKNAAAGQQNQDRDLVKAVVDALNAGKLKITP